VIHSARTGPYARKIARFLPLDSLAAKTKAEWKKSAMVVLVQQWRSMKILLPKRGQVEKYCTYEFRASRAMVVIATKDTATLRTPGLYVRRLEGVGLMVRGESHLFHSDWDKVPEAPSNETADQISMDPTMRSTAACGQEMEATHKTPMRWHMFSRCSFLAMMA
jgi:hypothetical protein